LNQLLIAKGAPVSIVNWPDVASPSKVSKRGWIAGLSADLAMMRDIFQTISPLACVRQILALRRLAPIVRKN